MIPHSKPLVGDNEIEAVTNVLRGGCLSQGAQVAAFEEECAAFVGRQHGIAVNSGTAALHLALITLGVAHNDTVAIPSYACAALVHPVHWQNAEAVLCDIGPNYNLAAEHVPGTCKAVIVAHLFGKPCDVAQMPAGPILIEDIAQSIGGPTGTRAPVCIASFYATKMLTTAEGGMLLTDDAQIAEAARDLRDYDNRDNFRVRYSYKMNEMQAALGRVQLQRLPEFVARRRAIAADYTAALNALPLILPEPDEHVFFRYVVSTEDRDNLQQHLENKGIMAKRPVHRPAHHYLGGQYQNAETAHLECLSLPLYPAMSDQEVEDVVESVLSYFG